MGKVVITLHDMEDDTGTISMRIETDIPLAKQLTSASVQTAKVFQAMINAEPASKVTLQ